MKKLCIVFFVSVFLFSCFLKKLPLVSSCELVKRSADLEGKKISVTGTYVRTGLGESSFYDPSCEEESRVWVEFSDHIFQNLKNPNVLKLKKMIEKSAPIFKKRNSAFFTAPHVEAKVVFVGTLTRNKILQVTDDSPLSEQIEASEPKNGYKFVFTVLEIREFKVVDEQNNSGDIGAVEKTP